MSVNIHTVTFERVCDRCKVSTFFDIENCDANSITTEEIEQFAWWELGNERSHEYCDECLKEVEEEEDAEAEEFFKERQRLSDDLDKARA